MSLHFKENQKEVRVYENKFLTSTNLNMLKSSMIKSVFESKQFNPELFYKFKFEKSAYNSTKTEIALTVLVYEKLEI